MTDALVHDEIRASAEANSAQLLQAVQWLIGRIVACLEPGPLAARPDSSLSEVPADDAVGPAAILLEPSSRPEIPNLPLSLELVKNRFGLSRFEQELLLLCLAAELEPRVRELCAMAQGDPALRHPTFGLAINLFDDPAWDSLLPDGPLRRWHLIEIDNSDFTELTSRRLRVSERLLHFIKGLHCTDDRLAPLLTRVAPRSDSHGRSVALSAVVSAITNYLAPVGQAHAPPILHLRGRDARLKLALACNAAESTGIALYRTWPEAMSMIGTDIETFIRLWERECTLLPAALYIDSRAADLPPGALANLREILERVRSPIITGIDPRLFTMLRPCQTVDIASPEKAERKAAWSAMLQSIDPEDADRLAAVFDFDLSTISEVVGQVVASGANTSAAVWEKCLAAARAELDTVAQRVEPKATWDDLVLPERESAVLRRIASHVRHRVTVYDTWGFQRRTGRGLGISALFAGESGTGKTMAAEVLANDLGYELYRVDLSTTVSKYIGETEKNLRTLFDAGERGGLILFFDEADALFGKRSEIRDSHDRYANIQIDYLLQRMESYKGLSILATNRKSALDQAFLRRIRFVVDFPFPGAAETRRLWAQAFPDGVPLVGLDIERLAALQFTGGNIFNVALHSAFLAAERGQPVDTELVLEAARTELRKLGRPEIN